MKQVFIGSRKFSADPITGEEAMVQTNPTPNTNPQGMSVEDLKKRDFIVMIDMSGSMEEKDMPGGVSRWEAAQEAALSLARECEKYDNNGITVVVFNGKWNIYENVTSGGDIIKNIFTENSPHGSTNTSGALGVVLEAYLKSKATPETCKPITVVCLTDGRPDGGEDGEKALAKTIINAANHIDDGNEIGISFVQVGKDGHATAFLKRLDKNLTDEGAKYDIVNAITIDDLNDKALIDVLIEAVTN